MAERTLKTRISLLVKTFEEWQSFKDFVPLKGELCICTIPASTGAMVQEPAVLFKVGDGTTSFQTLGWSSALAADVYNWAKKENLDWEDVNDTFKESLKSYIKTEIPSNNFQYQIVSDGDYRWKLQRSEDGQTWIDATGSIDVSALQTQINSKVDQVLIGPNGKATIWNENDGGGAKFEHTDGVYSFVGVNDGGESGIAAQIYALKKETPDAPKGIGTRINVYRDKIFYISKKNNESGIENNDPSMELVVKKDLEELAARAGALKLLTVITIENSLNKDSERRDHITLWLADNSHTPEAGDVIIVQPDDVEYVYADSKWVELGNGSDYATKVALQEEVSNRVEGQADLLQSIENRKIEVISVADFGFDTNLRVNQQVTGSGLIDRVINATLVEDKKQIIIEMGDYKFNVVSIVDDKVKNIRGFAVETMTVPMDTLNDIPIIEKGVFVYNPTLNKTCSFYGKEIGTTEIEQLQQEMATKVDETDTLILDCNL